MLGHPKSFRHFLRLLSDFQQTLECSLMALSSSDLLSLKTSRKEAK